MKKTRCELGLSPNPGRMISHTRLTLFFTSTVHSSRPAQPCERGGLAHADHRRAPPAFRKRLRTRRLRYLPRPGSHPGGAQAHGKNSQPEDAFPGKYFFTLPPMFITLLQRLVTFTSTGNCYAQHKCTVRPDYFKETVRPDYARLFTHTSHGPD